MRPASLLTIYFSLLLALLCHLFPWVGQGVIFRPDFMLVVMLYWLLRAPNLCNVGTAWLVGLLVDLATGSLLGQHALSFTLTAFIGLKLSTQTGIIQHHTACWLCIRIITNRAYFSTTTEVIRRQ